ncbi:DNA-3-methyladenine glycosylase 2 [Massilia sp. TS11]|uniref:DNA-3-methyladenine glycosylase 2 n=1 Tax=Massilia sp. TS11 TaxID=2908003 RepID=UPI001EDC0DDE|nr:DNA-3-methyladenine glycosylase 2 [Massilia sp. TS11]MCG2582784.1 DNA-3-methyladenine glycosylase 2 [Massilia sp. TS11]
MSVLQIALPADYCADDALAFHARDTSGTAEQTGPDWIRKGMVLAGQACVLELQLHPGQAEGRLHGSGRVSAGARALAASAAEAMLGLRIDPAPFLRAVRRDPLMGPLARRRPGLRVIQSGTVFEALSWAIIGQQINLSFAISLRRTLITLAGRQHATGLFCYPEPADVLRLDADLLGQHKFSRAKAETLLRLARLAEDGTLDLRPTADIDKLCAQLLAVKGIGPWTVQYGLLRGIGHPDCSLHGDVAVRSAIARLLGQPDKPSLAEAEAWLARYAPQRTLAAAHLWASLKDEV